MHYKFKTLIWILLFPTLVMAQEKVPLDGSWNFKTDPYNRGEAASWFAPQANYDSWEKMDVPGNWDLQNDYAEYVGNAWYSRTFMADDQWENQAVRLVFQSVYNDCKVWVNGKEVGENHIGFLPFRFDISSYLKLGEENNITVLVNNMFKRGAIWNWGGIRRPVWLEVTDPVRMEYQHISAVPELKKGTADINIKIVSSNNTDADAPIVYDIVISRGGKVLKTHEIKTTIPADVDEFATDWSVKLPKSAVALWDFDYPHLYHSTISLHKNGGKVHELDDRFGIRKLEVSGNKLLLNGKSFRPVGFNVVPEDRFTGSTLPIERIKEDVDMMKELGVTFCRISHLALPKEYLDYLDEKGIMTFEEVSLWGKDVWVDPDHPMPKEWLERMVKEKYNHPSIAGWSIGNEIGFVDRNPKVMDYVKGAIAHAKVLDPNRLAIYVTHSAPSQDEDPVIYSDIIMLNSYGGWGARAQKTWEMHQKPIFVCEFGNVLNNEDPNLSQINITKIMDDMRGKEYLLGASHWTFNDYRSSFFGREGWSTPVSQNRCWGIVNTFRQKKRSYYAFRKEYAPVRGLEIGAENIAEKTAKISIIPRGVLDIPARQLEGYSLTWSVFDEDFKLHLVGEQLLKTINPGDAPFTINIDWEKQSEATGLKISLMDPQDYSVLDETIYFKAPHQPTIVHVNTAQDGIRLIIEPAKGAAEYFAKYTIEGETVHSDTTINSFIKIMDERIKLNKSMDFEVFSFNNFGESLPSKKITAAKDEDELPPEVWNVIRNNDDLVIGYSSSPYDYLYEVEYGFEPGNYKNSVGFKTKGVARIPDVATDKTIYLRMRVRKQWGFASEWTHEIKVD